MSVDTSRLDRCGWSSFDHALFFNEPGRLGRDVGPFFVNLLRDFSPGKRVLELCCGGGKLASQLGREGYHVTGVDLSEPMLRVARQQAAAQGDGICDRLHFVQADICTFDLGQTYDFILLEDDSFCYLLTLDEQLACLGRVQAHLAPGGYFFLSLATPQQDLGTPQPHTYDPVRQILTVQCEWVVQDQAGQCTVRRQGIERRRLIYPCELELLLRSAGFEVCHRWGDERRTPFGDPTRQQYMFLMRQPH